MTDLQPLLVKLEAASGPVEQKAREMFQSRWPDKPWDGRGTHRAYWRRQARRAITSEQAP